MRLNRPVFVGVLIGAAVGLGLCYLIHGLSAAGPISLPALTWHLLRTGECMWLLVGGIVGAWFVYQGSLN